MKNHLNQYMEASGVRQSKINQIRDSFENIKVKIPNLSEDPLKSAMQIKEALFMDGFSYQLSSFNIQDVLKNKGGNCLGLPILIGTLIGELGFDPKYRIVVNPVAERRREEDKLFSSFNDDMSYHRPELATEYKDPYYFFAPLEHLVLDEVESFIGGETKPHTDRDVYNHLVESGYEISRGDVALARNKLGINPSSMRYQ